MPVQSLEYPKQPFSTVRRYDSRATYSLEQIHQIINTSHLVNVSFTVPDSPFPQTLPMIGQMGSFDRPSADTGDVLDLYLHGYVSSRIMNLSRKGGGDSKEPAGLPITVAASHVDGLVLSLTPNSHSYNYRSATLFGYATPVTDTAEKLWAMELITNSVVRDRWRNTRVPPNGAEMQSTSVLKVKITAGSAKIRSGPPSDEKGDAQDEALLNRVWTGVVPVHSVFGEPIPSPYNQLGQVPGYLGEYVKGANAYAEETALEQAGKAMKPKGKTDD
ncbi:5-nitroimidazole antibiotic resistance protein [Apiospora kogelbergensis]|uniref:5-nitroimidazole antibiotic resistance protein n=1 Tax=Apiospora kogelbergensis TaxID=1337665 RepID=UPI00312F6E5A